MTGRWGFQLSNTLREQDRLAFDRLMDRVRDRASAASFLVEESPLESALVAALVGHEREIQRLREEVTELRGALPPPGIPPLVVPLEDATPSTAGGEETEDSSITVRRARESG